MNCINKNHIDIDRATGNVFGAYYNGTIYGFKPDGSHVFPDFHTIRNNYTNFTESDLHVVHDAANSRFIVEYRNITADNIYYQNSNSTSYMDDNVNYQEDASVFDIYTYDVVNATCEHKKGFTQVEMFGSNNINRFSRVDKNRGYAHNSTQLSVFHPMLGRVISIADETYSVKTYDTYSSSESSSAPQLYIKMPAHILIYDPDDINKTKKIHLSKLDGITHMRTDYWHTAQTYADYTKAYAEDNTTPPADYSRGLMPFYLDIQVCPRSGNVIITNTREIFRLTPDCETVLNSFVYSTSDTTHYSSCVVAINPLTEEITINQNSNQNYLLNADLSVKITQIPNVSYPRAFLPGLLEESTNEIVPADIVFPGDDQLLGDLTPTVTFKVNSNPTDWVQQFRVIADRDIDKLRAGSAATVYERNFDSWSTGGYYNASITWEYSTDFDESNTLDELNGTWTILGTGEALQSGSTHITDGIDSNQGQFYVRMTVPDTDQLDGADTGDIWEFKVYSYSKYVG